MGEGVRSLVLAGVGGQGVVLASAIVAEALLLTGCDVKQSEVHGMAQRGGSVFSHVRFGREVGSPLVPLGRADALVGFEWAEILRWLPYVRSGGSVVANVNRVVPPGACQNRGAWSSEYPPVRVETLRDRTADARLIDATAIATGLGNPKAANSVVLGALAALLTVPLGCWEEAIRRHVPQGTETVNVAAFRAGKNAPPVPVGASQPGRDPGPNGPRPRIEIDQAWCKACDICTWVCPEYCLTIDESEVLVVLDPDACTGCRLCELLCPDFAITIHRDSFVGESALATEQSGWGGVRE